LGVLDDGLLRFKNDRVEQATDSLIIERWLETGHSIEGNSHSPDITTLVVTFIFNYFWRKTQWSSDNFGGLDIALLIENSGLTHVTEFNGCVIIFASQK
jgi:hypothetical protein